MNRNSTMQWRKQILRFLLPLALVLLFFLLKGQVRFVNFWVFQIIGPLQQGLGRIFSPLPFSVAEVLLFGFLLWGVIGLFQTLYQWIRRPRWHPILSLAQNILCIGLWSWAILCWMWNITYSASTFVLRSGMTVHPYSVTRLTQATQHFAQQAADYAAQVSRGDQGSFSPDIRPLFQEAQTIYHNISETFPFLSLPPTSLKPIAASKFQSYLGFTGIYSPLTGEANVNVDAPRCLLPATIAHEMAHQRMIALEDEANFVGILAAITSDSLNFRYSGYLLGLIQLSNALHPVAPQAWREIVQTYFTPELSQDWEENRAYWMAHTSPIEEAAGQVYDSFLKGNGQDLGLKSYGACVDLLIAFLEGSESIPQEVAP